MLDAPAARAAVRQVVHLLKHLRPIARVVRHLPVVPVAVVRVVSHPPVTQVAKVHSQTSMERQLQSVPTLAAITTLLLRVIQTVVHHTQTSAWSAGNTLMKMLHIV